MGIFSRDRATQSNLSRHYSGQGPKHKKELGTSAITLMTVGGIIGSGLFLASGAAIREAGPALVFAYLIGATAMAIEVTALAEMSAADPEEGSFLVYSRRVLGPGYTFVGGWVFWFSSVLNLAAEATAAGTFMRLWLPHLPLWIVSTTFALLIIGINFLTVKGFGEVESGMSVIKIAAIGLFILLFGLAIFTGWPVSIGHGIASWSVQGGFFPHGIKGIGAAMIVVMFSMAGTGVLGLAAASVRRPERTIRHAVRYTVIIVYLLYMGAALAITGAVGWMTVPGTGQSPFLVALHHMPWPLAVNVFNAVILLAVLSAMNAGLFATDRVLEGLARAHDAPHELARSSHGIPRWANAVTGTLLVIVTLLTYFLPKTAYIYLVTATGFQAIFVWILIVGTQIRYRGWLKQHRPHHLRLKLAFHPYLAWAEIALLVLIIATAPLAPHQVLPLGLGLAITGLFAVAYWLLRRRRAEAS